MIDDATIKRVADDLDLLDYKTEVLAFARTIEQLARAEQREEDARICEGMTERARTTKASRLMARECMAAIRASGEENSNERP